MILRTYYQRVCNSSVCSNRKLILFRHTVYAEITVGEIFRRLNFRGVKFLWLKPPTKIWPLWQFARWKDGCWVQKKAMRAWIPRLQRHMGSCCWRNAGLRERAEERSWQVRSGGQKRRYGHRPLAKEGVACLCSVAKVRQKYSLHHHWKTKILSYLTSWCWDTVFCCICR